MSDIEVTPPIPPQPDLPPTAKPLTPAQLEALRTQIHIITTGKRPEGKPGSPSLQYHQETGRRSRYADATRQYPQRALRHRGPTVQFTRSVPHAAEWVVGSVTVITAAGLLALMAKNRRDKYLLQQLEYNYANNGMYIGGCNFDEDDLYEIYKSHPSISWEAGPGFGYAQSQGLKIHFAEIDRPQPRWFKLVLPISRPTRRYAGVFFSTYEWEPWFTSFFMASMKFHTRRQLHESGFQQDVMEGPAQILAISPGVPKQFFMPVGEHIYPTHWEPSTWSLDILNKDYLALCTHGATQFDAPTLPYVTINSSAQSPNHLLFWWGSMNPKENTILFDYAFVMQWGEQIRTEYHDPPTDAPTPITPEPAPTRGR